MKVRGRRECKRCGTRWAYYDTGSVACPECGSVESVGVGDRALHTDSPADLDLAAVRERLDADPFREVADAATSACRRYVRKRGFLDGGDLLDLDGTYLAARELAEAADVAGRRRALDDDEEWYVLELLRSAEDGERPAPEAVPDSMRAARGLAATRAVDDYLGDCRDWLDEHPRPAVDPVLERFDDHRRRVHALEGDVPPHEADRLVAAARDLGRALRDDDGSALDAVEGRLDDLG